MNDQLVHVWPRSRARSVTVKVAITALVQVLGTHASDAKSQLSLGHGYGLHCCLRTVATAVPEAVTEGTPHASPSAMHAPTRQPCMHQHVSHACTNTSAMHAPTRQPCMHQHVSHACTQALQPCMHQHISHACTQALQPCMHQHVSHACTQALEPCMHQHVKGQQCQACWPRAAGGGRGRGVPAAPLLMPFLTLGTCKLNLTPVAAAVPLELLLLQPQRLTRTSGSHRMPFPPPRALLHPKS
eukprot:352526-Chlamydomonas_euryale.AAC.11